MEISTFKSLAEKISEIAYDATSGGPCFYRSQSLFFSRNNTKAYATDLELRGLCNIRCTKSTNVPSIFCTLRFAESTDGAKMIVSIEDTDTSFEATLKARLEPFLQENKELVELGMVEAGGSDVQKDEQNQRPEVSRDEKLIELRAGKSSDVFYLWYCGVVMAICLAIIRAYFLSSQGAPVVPIVAGLAEITGIVGIIVVSRRLREKNEKIKALTEAQETTGDNVQPGK